MQVRSADGQCKLLIGQRELGEGVEEVFKEVHGIKDEVKSVARLVGSAEANAYDREMAAMNDRKAMHALAVEDRHLKNKEVVMLLKTHGEGQVEVRDVVKGNEQLLLKLLEGFKQLGVTGVRVSVPDMPVRSG